MKFLLIGFLILYGSHAFSMNLLNWSINTQPQDIIVPVQMKPFSALQIHQATNEFLVMAQEYGPQSISAVKKIITKMKGQEKTLLVIKKTGKTYFRFQTSNQQYHFFSTVGGYLQVNSKSKADREIASLVNL